MDYLSILKLMVHYLSYPILILSKPITILLLALITPIFRTAQGIVHTCLWPLRFMARFETLYIFLSVALLVGLLAGVALHYTSGILTALFDLDCNSEEPQRGRTMASYRARREKLRCKTRIPPMVTQVSPSAARENTLRNDFAHPFERDTPLKKSLLTATILEEDDTSDASL